MKEGGQVLYSQYMLSPNSICRHCVLCLSETTEHLCYTVRQDMALWILCSHLWDCGRWSPFNTHTHTVLLTMPQTWEQLPGTILGQRAPLLCVCMRGRQTERNDHKELAQIPRPVVDKGATLEGWWYSFSLRAGRWRHGGPNVLAKFEIRKKKKKSVPAWGQLGWRNSLLSA